MTAVEIRKIFIHLIKFARGIMERFYQKSSHAILILQMQILLTVEIATMNLEEFAESHAQELIQNQLMEIMSAEI